MSIGGKENIKAKKIYQKIKRQLQQEKINRQHYFSKDQENDHYHPRKKTLQELINSFQKATTYEEKKAILNEIENIKGSIPIDLKLELNKMRKEAH